MVSICSWDLSESYGLLSRVLVTIFSTSRVMKGVQLAKMVSLA